MYENNFFHISNENETTINDDVNGREETWVVLADVTNIANAVGLTSWPQVEKNALRYVVYLNHRNLTTTYVLLYYACIVEWLERSDSWLKKAAKRGFVVCFNKMSEKLQKTSWNN